MLSNTLPAFIVWREFKAWPVVDLRRVNTKVEMKMTAYPLHKQEDILSFKGSEVFTVMDLTKGFLQQPIAEEDKWKLPFLTPHRCRERFTVSIATIAIFSINNN